MPRNFFPTPLKLRQTHCYFKMKEALIKQREENAEDFSVTINDFIKKKWKVFRVSPLYNFNKDKLKIYENKLLNELNSSKRNNLYKSSYKSTFILNENLSVNNQSKEVLKVKVTENEIDNAYLGYFISSNHYKADSVINSKFLSVLLVKAKNKTSHEVHLALCKMFDCDIQPVTFSLRTLIMFLVKILENPIKSENNSQEVMQLEYKIPGCPVEDSIKVTLMLEEVTIIFAVVIDHLRGKISGITDMEIIVEFYNRIINHIYNTYKLDLMLTELHKIIFPHAFIARDGQLKFSREDDAGEILSILQKTCLPIQQF